jgi:hypothetical protein
MIFLSENALHFCVKNHWGVTLMFEWNLRFNVQKYRTEDNKFADCHASHTKKDLRKFSPLSFASVLIKE